MKKDLTKGLWQKHLPYKSVAVSLLFTVVLGPVGLLYASYWRAIFMILLGIVVCCSQLFFPILLLWIICCVLGVGACGRYNKKIAMALTPTQSE